MSTQGAGSHALPTAAGPERIREWPLLLVLAGAQFAHVLDFVIMMPLGPQFMREFSISPQQFGFLVSSYTFSAAICGFAGSLLVDRFDRKSALLVLTMGFMLGTIACGLAPSYDFLLMGRALAGGFGGLMGAVVFAIIGDSIHESRRGAATGTVMSAFSIASVIGVPVGLWAAHLSWRVPFFGLAGISLVIFIVAMFVLPALRGHLRVDHQRAMKEELRFMIYTRSHWRAYGMIVALMLAAFSVIPFLATYLVKNVGLSESDLPYVYLSGGLFTLVTSRLVGRIADRYGKQRVFVIMAALSIVPILLMTHLPRVSVFSAILATTLFTVLISARAVPAMSMITSTVESQHRGSFMSFTLAVQQSASGIATLLSGLILSESSTGELLHYNWVGYLAVLATALSMLLGRRLKIIGGS